MSKNQRFSPFTISQNSVLSAYTSLTGLSQSSQLVITIPSNRGFTYPHKAAGNALEDIPDAIESWTQTAREYARMWDAEKIKEVTDIIRESLDEGQGESVTYEVTFHRNWGGEVELDSVLPENYPTIGEKSNYFRSYTEKVTVKTNDPNKVFSEMNKLKESVNQKTNIDTKSRVDRDVKEKSYKEINERIKGDASFDKGYKEHRDRAEGREGTMWA